MTKHSREQAIPVTNPRTGDVLYEVHECPQDEVDAVFRRAEAAGQTLRRMPVQQRVAETLKLRDYIRDNRETICRRIIEETGKSRMDALLAEIYAALDIIDASHHRRLDSWIAPVQPHSHQ